MKKLCNFRIETILLKELDQLDGSRTQNVTNAIQSYLQINTAPNSYNVDLVDLLKNQVEDLKDDKHYLQSQVNAFLVTKQPLLQRIIMKLKE